MYKKLHYFVFLFVFILSSGSLYAKQTVKFGVFAYLGVEETRAKYEPIVEYLNTKLEEETVILEVLTQEELDKKIANQTLDIATTNPTHFLLIRQKEKISGVIATLMESSDGIPLSQLGGVIITKEDSHINLLEDIRSKTIATPSIKHMGGYRAQAYELYKAGINLPNDVKSISELKTHQDVVRSIVNGEYDIGFVRNGIIEKMVLNKEIRKDDIKIINQQNYPYFPHKVSTALYPEWPLFALSHVNEHTIRHIASALFSIDAQSEVAKKSSIFGYTVASDYSTVEELARALRLPPFDKAPNFTIKDIWDEWSNLIIAFIITILIIIVLAILLLLMFKKEKKEKDFRKSLLSSIGDGVFGTDRGGNCNYINDAALNMLGFELNEVLNKNYHFIFHYKKQNGKDYDVKDSPILSHLSTQKAEIANDWFVKKDGLFLPVSLTITSTADDGVLVVFKDISRTLQYEKILKEEVKLKTKELQELNASLEEKIAIEVEKNQQQHLMLQQQSRLAALGEMIGNIAHQWRQPLNSITTRATGLKFKEDMGMIEEGDITEMAEGIMKNAEYLSSTIDDFRNFFTEENEKMYFIVQDCFKNTLDLVYSSLSVNFIELKIKNNQCPPINYFGFSNELGQVFMNILNNAKDVLKDKDQKEKIIEVSFEENKEDIIITISDNGGGIDDEIKEKIFDPYFTTKHQSQGTGLGLYMSSKIVVEHFNGMLSVENKEMIVESQSYIGASFIIILKK